MPSGLPPGPVVADEVSEPESVVDAFKSSLDGLDQASNVLEILYDVSAHRPALAANLEEVDDSITCHLQAMLNVSQWDDVVSAETLCSTISKFTLGLAELDSTRVSSLFDEISERVSVGAQRRVSAGSYASNATKWSTASKIRNRWLSYFSGDSKEEGSRVTFRSLAETLLTRESELARSWNSMLRATIKSITGALLSRETNALVAAALSF